MIPELEPEEFVSFLADLWRERGWEISVRERPDETRFVVGKRGDGKRGIIYVFPTTTATVTERHVKQFISFCQKRGIDVAVVATQGAFADGAQRVAAERSVHLLDRSTLADTVEAGGFEDLLREYTEPGRLEAIVERLRALGVPVPEGAVDAVPDAASLRARLPFGGDGADAADGEAGGPEGGSDDAGGGGLGGDAGPLARARALALQSVDVPAGMLPVILLIAFVVGATMGPAVGLASPFTGGGDGLDVSAVSTATPGNATVHVRWNAKTTRTLKLNGTTYDLPDGQTFLLVRMNVTNRGSSPVQFSQSALAVEVAGRRYGHQPLDGVTGFPSAGLFEPGESREVWTVFTIPADAQSATLLVEGDLRVRFVRTTELTPEATVPKTPG